MSNPDQAEDRAGCDHTWRSFDLRGRGNLIRHGGKQRVLICDYCDETIEEAAAKHSKRELELKAQGLRQALKTLEWELGKDVLSREGLRSIVNKALEEGT